jgi:DNA-binding NarL/FixJ family response regulator
MATLEVAPGERRLPDPSSHPMKDLPESWNPELPDPDVAQIARTVVLVDDHVLVRLGMETLLRNFGRVSCKVVHCRSLAEARVFCATKEPIDLVLLDLNLCDAKGLQGLRLLREDFPQLPVAVLTGTQDEFVIQQARALGAKGYLLKSWNPQQLRAALYGMLVEAPEAGAGATDAYPHTMISRNSFDRVAQLGTRHLEILELILSGCNNREIASTTGLSIGTVKNYVSAILLALDVRSRGHLISLFH